MTPRAQLESFIDKYSPEMAREGRAALRRLRRLAPGAVERCRPCAPWLPLLWNEPTFRSAVPGGEESLSERSPENSGRGDRLQSAGEPDETSRLARLTTKIRL